MELSTASFDPIVSTNDDSDRDVEGADIECVEDFVGITAAEAAEVDAMLATQNDENQDSSNILKFKHAMAKFKVPFLIYADLEAFIVKIGDKDDQVTSDFFCLRVRV